MSILDPTKVTLHPYQKRMIDRMGEIEEKVLSRKTWSRGGFITDGMGAGKTLMMLYHSLFRPIGEYPTLIVCAKTLIHTWLHEIKKFYGTTVSVLVLHKDYNKLVDDTLIRDAHIVITTYDVVGNVFCHLQARSFRQSPPVAMYSLRDMAPDGRIGKVKKICPGYSLLFSVVWGRIVLDESTSISNRDTKYHRGCMTLAGYTRWCMSGEPIVNWELDLYSQYRFIGYDRGRDAWTPELFKENCLPYYLQTPKEELESCIQKPRLTIIDRKLFVNDESFFDFYKILLEGAITEFYRVQSKQSPYAQVLKRFNCLRLICHMPRLCKDEELTNVLPEELSSWFNYKNGTSGDKCPKTREILNIINHSPKSEKILIFSPFVCYLKALKKHIPDAILLTGSMSTIARNEGIQEFKTKKRILMSSYKLLAKGVNLTEASIVICAGSYWNEATIRQAYCRSWRQGQTKPVTVHLLSLRHTIEEVMENICETKKKRSDAFITGQGNFCSKKESRLSLEKLGEMLNKAKRLLKQYGPWVEAHDLLSRKDFQGTYFSLLPKDIINELATTISLYDQ